MGDHGCTNHLCHRILRSTNHLCSTCNAGPGDVFSSNGSSSSSDHCSSSSDHNGSSSCHHDGKPSNNCSGACPCDVLCAWPNDIFGSHSHSGSASDLCRTSSDDLCSTNRH